jgi:hypothetical protein
VLKPEAPFGRRKKLPAAGSAAKVSTNRRIRKMEIAENKTLAIAIAMLLAFSITASMMLIPSAGAQSSSTDLPTYAYINVAPNPTGVGQQVLIIMWLTNIFSPDSTVANDYRFHNYELTITAPDGTKTTTTFATVSDPTSDQDTYFTPTAVGTYTLNFTFPGQPFDEYAHDTSFINPLTGVLEAEPYLNDVYLPSSAQTTLTVQSTAVPAYPTTPLPTAYWTRPIYGINSNWYTVSSNWLGQGSPVESCVGSGAMDAWDANGQAAINRYPGDAVGSLTCHIMWTKPLDQGGVVGGDNFAIAGDTYFEGSAYVQHFKNPIIMDGILIYQAPLGYDYPTGPQKFIGPFEAAGSGGGTYGVDLQTGQQLWYNPNIPVPSFPVDGMFGYIYDAQNVNQKGVEQPILFTPDFGQAYDAWTGQYLFNCTNMPSGGPWTMGPNGEILMYVVYNAGTPSSPDWQLAQWNSSNIWSWNVVVGAGSPNPDTSTFTVGTTTYHNTVNLGAGSMYDYIGPNGAQNITISPQSDVPSSFSQIAEYYGNMILCESGALPNTEVIPMFPVISSSAYEYFAINLNSTRGTVGSVLWKNTVQPPAGNLTVMLGPTDPTTGVFTEAYQQTMQWVGYSLTTGAKIWGPTPSQAPLDFYGNPTTPEVQGQCAYGNLYSMGYAGIMYCYNDLTGVLRWTFGNGGAGNSTKAGPNTPFGDYPSFIVAVGDGVIYVTSSEHTVSTPIYKGALARAINATTGQEIWTVSDYTGSFNDISYAMADGYNTWDNGYDNQIYVVGRGPSASTVTASPAVTTFGDNVVIRGTVMDVSAGTKQTEQAADFPYGVPCASDASMSAWMSYVYQQQPEPTNFTGVKVTLSVLDSNGNHYNIGTATTDASGTYSLTWTPIIPGNYTVYATFAGTNGYWPSNAETTFNIMSAPPTPAPTASPVSLVTTQSYIIGIGIAIIVVIIIIGVVLAMLMLRKRP